MSSEQLVYQLMFERRWRVLSHVLFWVVIYLDEFLSFVGVTEVYETAWYLIIVELLFDVVMVYINLYVLIPRFLLKRKLFLYLLTTALSILAVILINIFIFDPGPDWSEYSLSYFISGILFNMGVLSVAIAIKLFKIEYQNRKRLQELERLNLETELKYLKIQVNPHFLFNALNNIYIQSRVQPKVVPEAVLTLSDLLRYQIYDCSKDKVALRNEIKYLEDYIKLESVRRDQLDVQFEIEGDPITISIAPLILIPLVENAFKYSNDTTGRPASIRMRVVIEGQDLHFFIENTKGNVTPDADNSGIGLANVRRRLDLIYPARHCFKIEESETEFKVSLSLQS